MKIFFALVAILFAAIMADASPLLSPKGSSLATELGFHDDATMENYFHVEKIVITENGAGSATTVSPLASTDTSNFDQPFIGLTDISTWITVGEKVWTIIKDGKPVADISTHSASVLPIEQTNWQDLENWQGPYVKSYTIEAKNLLGMTVASQTYRVMFNYGGTFNGKGQYLANATIIPAQVSIAWGFSLNTNVEIGNAVNTGTKDHLIPALQMELVWKIDSALKHLEGRNSFYIKGNGEVRTLNATAVQL